MVKFRLMLVSLFAVLALAFPVAFGAAPALASCTLGICGTLVHSSPDTGYDPPFLIACNWRDGGPIDVRYLYEGESSKKYCQDADGVYVNPGTHIDCVNIWAMWPTRWDATGWHKFNDQAGGTCVYQLD